MIRHLVVKVFLAETDQDDNDDYFRSLSMDTMLLIKRNRRKQSSRHTKNPLMSKTVLAVTVLPIFGKIR